MKKIYILRGEVESGPFELSEIFSKLAEGTLDPRDQARREGETEWRPLEEILQGGSALFSVEQIEQMREEDQLEPAAVPDLQPLRPIAPSGQPRPKRGLPLIAALAVLLLIIEGVVAIYHRGSDSTEDGVASASPVPSPSIAPQIASQPTPSRAPAEPTKPSSVSIAAQPSPKATRSAPEPPPIAAHSPPATKQLIEAPAPAPAKEPEPAHDSQPVATSHPPATSEPSPSATLLEEPPKPVASTTPEPTPTAKPSPEAQAIAAVSSTPSALVPSPTPSTTAVPSSTPSPPVGISNISTQPTPIPFGQRVYAADFFKVESVQLLKKEPKSKIGVWHAGPGDKFPTQFSPCLEVKVSARENTRSDQTFAKAYFFDEHNKLLVTLDNPSLSGKLRAKLFSMPVLFYKEKPDSIFFGVPKAVDGKNWKAVVVFGDKHEAHVACFPANETDFAFEYPEKQLVHDAAKRIARKPAMDPLIQYEVKTKNPRQPKITLFLRPPKGISSADDVDGVLCICILAQSIDNIKRALQKEEMDGDYQGLLGFANKHRLAVLAWGSTGLWNPAANYDDLGKSQAQAMDKSFDLVADAWERGVHELGEKYGIPQSEFLLWGACGSAQWAHRLCLRKPDLFLAIDIHLAGSYDKPTPEASRVLWCVTTGERDGGYERSIRFASACRKAGYPITYKAIVGLGHAGHPDATAMGFKFFEFALKQRNLREDYDKKLANNLDRAKILRDRSSPWHDSFQSPPFYGDIVNQEMYPPDQAAMIPEGFRVPLPTKEIADIWARSH